MKRLLPGAFAVVLVASAAVAGYPARQFQITFRDQKGKTKLHLAVVDGKLTTLPEPLRSQDRTAKTSDIWYVDGTRLKSAAGGYLAYDLSGDDARVFLAPMPGDNTEWKQELKPEGATSRTLSDVKGWTATFYAGRGKAMGRALCAAEPEPGDGEKADGPPQYQTRIGSTPSSLRAYAWREVIHP
jgi:hypothetical protein